VYVALIIVSAAAGFLAGPWLVTLAERSLDKEGALRRAGDAAIVLGRSPHGHSLQTIAVRVAVGGLAAAVVASVGSRFVVPAYLWFVAITVVLTVTDVRAKLIPNRITAPGGLVGAGLLAVGVLLDGDPERLLWALIGAVGYFLFMLVLALIVPGGLGFGDVKLAPFLGAFVAAEHLGFVVIAAVGSYLIGGITSALLLITRIKSRKDTIPFGPYMVVAAYVALFAGNAIVDWYLG
jgi:leader peptidase (prepilin peptidase)/N-methyltransferase